MNASVLVVDDDLIVQDSVKCLLDTDGYDVTTAATGEEALSRLARQGFDVVVSDIKMPGLTGLDVLERSRMLSPRPGVVLMTCYATVDTAIEALRRGASDYLLKPFEVDDLRLGVQRALHHREPVEAARPPGPAVIGHLVGDSPAMLAVREQIARCAPTPSHVLITGESGVGKEPVAEAIHAASPRHDRPFIAVNCGAIPDTLIESQLVAANHGTLFLDEIDELPFHLQITLLRAIENRQVWPVGATRGVAVDVRIIASTNRDLRSEVQAGRFREDLFYRLNVVHIRLPSLRDRRDDIPLLVSHLLHRLNAKLGTAFAGVDTEALGALVRQPWKGNVRELENVLERSMVLGGGSELSLRHLALDLTPPPAPEGLRAVLRRFERQYLREVLAEVHDDKRAAARILQISLASLYRKLGSGRS
jgi:two-component system, NtrC family, response regulator PilR